MRFGVTIAAVAACVFSVLLSHSAAAQDTAVDRGPAIGAQVAFAAAMEAQDGKTHQLSDLHGSAGTALVFNRSLSWCPFCKAQTEELIANASMLTDLGYSIAVITYDVPDVLAGYAAKHDAPFPLLSDSQSQTIIRFGLLNEDYEPGSFAYGIPHPMIVVVGTDNKVKAKFAKASYRVRPALTEVVAGLTP